MTTRTIYTLYMLVLCTAGSALAQQLGELSGNVHDVEGAPVGGVGIVAENDATGERHSTATTRQGQYRIVALPPGTYTVTASSAGFETMVRENVRVETNSVTRLDFDQRSGFIGDAPSLERLSVDFNFGYSAIGGIDTDLVKPGATLEGSVRYNFGFVQVAGGLRVSTHSFRNVNHRYKTFLPFLEFRKHIMIGTQRWYPFLAGRVGYALESMVEAGATFRASGPAIGASVGIRYQANSTIGLELGTSYDYFDFGDYEADAASIWRGCIDTEGGQNMTSLIRTVETCSPPPAPLVGERGFITYEGTARSVQEFRIFLGATIILTKAGG